MHNTVWSLKDRTSHNRWQLCQMWTNFHNFCTIKKKIKFSTEPT